MSQSAFPTIEEVTDIEMAFGTTKALPPWESLTADEQRMLGPFCDALSSLFYKGGKLSDYGLTPKPGVDAAKVSRLIRAHLCSWEPKHEHKIGGVAHLLAQWYDAKGKTP